MADHLDFIQIRGLKTPGEEEVFQGLGGAALTVEGDAGGGSINAATGSDLKSMLEEIGSAFPDIVGWISGQHPEPEEPRGMSRGSRMLPAIIGGGALALTAALPPVIIGTAVISAESTIIRKFIEALLDDLDPTSERSRLKQIVDRLDDINDTLHTGLIWEDGILGIDKSILGTALLQLSEDEKSILQARLKELQLKVGDLALVDAIIQFGDDLKARIKGKALEF